MGWTRETSLAFEKVRVHVSLMGVRITRGSRPQTESIPDLALDHLADFLRRKVQCEHRGHQRAEIGVRHSPPRLNRPPFFPHPRQHPKCVSFRLEKRAPLPMPQAEIAKRADLLHDLVMGIPKHKPDGHVL